MKDIDALKIFVKADKSIVCNYNRKSRKVNDFIYYVGNEVVEKKNYSLEEFCEFLATFFNVDFDIEMVLKTIRDILNDKDIFDLPFIFKDENDNPIKVRFKGGLLDKDNLAVAIINEKNKSMASIDGLTKCEPLDKLKEKVEQCIKAKENFILGIVDIDYFKDFNEKYGTVYGDIVLIELTNTLKNILKTNGMIARIGGDSFVYYYKTNGDYEAIRALVLDIKDKIKENINKALNVETAVSTTMGVSRSYVDGDKFTILYNKALKALERGKKKSRDCFIIYFEAKCGPVDDIDRLEKIHYEESSTANYSCLAAVVEVLNSNLTFARRIEETMSLIGSFFMLDRITIIEKDVHNNEIKNVLSWYNPRSPKADYCFTDDMIDPWQAFLGKANLVIVDDSSKVENTIIRNSLQRSHIFAVVASELRIDGKNFGLIQFEMTSHTRVWQKENTMALGLLVKIIATRYNKEFETNEHFKQMYFDPETELYNLHKWFEDVTAILEENKTTKSLKKFTILDIGIMKYSTLVSIVGVKVVRIILKAIADSFRGLGNIGIEYCRSYENRFTLFIPNDDTYLVKNLFKRVVNAISDVKGEDGERVSIRAGYYVVDLNSTSIELDEMVDRAVAARKKASSTKSIVEFNEEMLVIDKFRTMLVSHIDTALENDEFIMYLQPKISTKTGLVAGAEALTRWDYNFEKTIFPDEFIPILEANGYIAKLDFKVFENVCKFIKSLEEEGKSPIPISVNVSRSIRDFTFYFDKLERIRKKYDVDPGLIEIEITEGMYSLANQAIEDFIGKLHSVGYKVSMDDFGSGNSNISTLSQLTFDTIKFDKGFFNDIDNAKERMIIDTMTKLVKGMDMTVVCEGIETKDYVEYLTKIGADYIQGYYYSKPIILESFKEKYID